MSHPPKAIITAMVSHPPKALATLQARAALAGHTCNVDGAGRSMTFGSLSAAEDWLSKVTGVSR